ncbi:MAG: zinc-binding loop region of homing endonuclease [Bacteriophage sp.]|nr:MAG: zinc-binding loop region of homing endonuclease [Bacteriophage sp.]
MNIKNRTKVLKYNIPKVVKPIPGILDSLITRSGRVFLKEKGIWYEIIPKINRGRLRLTIRGKNWPLHRLLALAWVPNPNPNEYHIVRHLDDDPLNNKLSNLRWGTPKMNTHDCIRNGNFFLPKPRYGKKNNLYGKRGSKSPRSVVTKEVYIGIRYLYQLGYNKRSLSRILLLHPNTINRVLNNPQHYEY